jgi:hypothetical protein
MKKFLIFGLALATALAIAPAAKATSTTLYVGLSGTNTGNPNGTSGLGIIPGSGTLQATLISGTTYDVTGGTLWINGVLGTVIANPSYPTVIGAPGGGPTYNDKINLASGPNYVDAGGLLFSLPGSIVAEIWYDSGNDVLTYYNDITHTWDPPVADGYDVSFSVSSTPEPSSLLLLGTGLFLMAGFLFRKYKLGVN